jgi:nicotinamidase-related amidase/alkylated DNA repair dioxygenase AlkB
MSFLSALLSGSHNQISTRQALLVVGLQNDFTSPQGKLPVNTATGYLERIKELVPAFREHGEIFWITTEYRGKRSVNHPSGSGCMVIADDSFVLPMVSSDDEMNDYPSRPSMRSNRRINQVIQRTMNRSFEADSESSSAVDQDLFLSQDTPEDNCCLPGSWGAELSPEVKDLVSPKDVRVIKSYYSAFTSSSLLLMLRAKLITEVYVVGCTTNLSVYATALDAAQHGLSINLVEDCLNYRLKDRHDRAVQKLVEIMGASVTTSASVLSRLRGETHTDESGNDTGTGQSDVDMEDQPGTVREPSLPSGLERYLESLRLSDDQPRTAGGAKHTPLEHAKSTDPQPPDTTDHRREPNPRPVRSRRRHDDMQDNRTIQSRSRMTKDNNANAAPYASSRGSREGLMSSDRSHLRQKSKSLETRVVYDSPPNPRLNDSLEADPVSEQGHEVERTAMDPRIDQHTAPAPPKRVSRKLQMRQKNSTLLSPDDKIGSGDSEILYDLLESEAANVAFQDLFTEIHWQQMYHAAGEVPRLVCCQGDIDDTDGSMPVYRHPSDQSLPLLRWSPVVSKIKQRAEERVGHKLNHALIQLYRSGQDHISEHSDKTLDIVEGSKIVNVSLGAQRTMRLRTKRPTAVPNVASISDRQQRPGDAQTKPEDDRSRVTQRIPMPHNSMFIMGLETNGSWLHGIMPDKRPATEQIPAESAYGNMRISITFRLIGTFISADSRLIWGQGAVAKHKLEARPTINGNVEESQRLINAFGIENQMTAPEWSSIYGSGFDVLHLKYELPEHEKPMLFLSGDEDSDAAVTARLSKLGIDAETVTPPTERLTDNFVDANGELLVVASVHRRVICFRQAGGMHTEVQGKTAILRLFEDAKSHA